MNHVARGSGLARDELFTQATAAFEERVLFTTCGWMNRKSHAGYNSIHHSLNQHANPRLTLRESVLFEIAHYLRTLGGVPACHDPLHQLRQGSDLKLADILAGEARPGKILEMATGPGSYG